MQQPPGSWDFNNVCYDREAWQLLLRQALGSVHHTKFPPKIRADCAVCVWQIVKILRRYLFLEIQGPFFLGLLVFSFVLFTRAIARPLQLLVQKNVTLQEVLLMLLYLLPNILTFSIPMAALLGILICFGRLSADSEITAMGSSGVSIRNLLLPVIVFAWLAWLVAMVNSNYWEPRVNYRFRLMRNDIALRSISTEVQPR